MRKLFLLACLSMFVVSSALAWPGVVLVRNGVLYWGQYKNVSGVMAMSAPAADLTTAIREYPLAGVSSVVLRAQQAKRPFFDADGAAIAEADRRRMQQDLDTVNTLEMLPIVVLFDPDSSCRLKNVKAYATAALTFQQTFGKANYFLLCVTDRCDDSADAEALRAAGWKKGIEMVQEAVKAVHGAVPTQMIAAGGSKPETNERLLEGDAPVNAIIARGVNADTLQCPVIEVLDPASLSVDTLSGAVRKTLMETRYGFALDFAGDAARTKILGQMFDAVDAYQKATYPGSAPDSNDATSLKSGEKEEGFASLFNGKDLTGWLEITAPNDFVVQDGAIRLVGKAGGWLRSWNVYKDYTLRLEFRIEDKGNNGVYNRCGPLGRQSRIGFELQVFGDPATLTPTKESCGAIYDVRPPDGHFIKPGDWNEYEVTCNGDDIKISLNGHVIHQLKYDDIDALKPRSRKGFIGLQDHHNTVEYRNIRIKPLN